jgi:hypothetical protein
VTARPNIVHGDFARPPAALRPLLARPQWAIWRLICRDGNWTKPPFQADNPDRHASSTDPSTWANYAAACAAHRAGHSDGLTYILTDNEGLAAADVDHVRDPRSGSIGDWAQQLLDQASNTYCELSPSGTGLRVWGTAEGAPLHSNTKFENGAGLELFRRTRKPLTVTGLQLGSCRQLGNIDPLLERAAAWADRNKTAAISKSPSGNIGIQVSAQQLSLEDIEHFVREAPPKVDGQSIRSNVFHTIVGHYRGCGWSAEEIEQHLGQFPAGIGGRNLAEGRLAGEIERSLKAFRKRAETFRQETISEARKRTLKQLAEHLLHHRIDPILAVRLVHSWNETRCQPPLETAEVDRIVDAAAIREQSRRERRR